MSTLPVDSHVHSEWSWDAGSDPASAGTMVRTCEQAVRIGLPGIVFTEHLDLEDDWRAAPGDLGGGTAEKYVDANGRVQLPRFDSGGFLDAIERSRREFPGLRILAGVEFGQPHLWEDKASELLSSGLIQRVNGSLHMLDDGADGRTEPATLYRSHEPESVMWAYLEEIPRMVANSTSFEVFTHIDYAVRSWPAEAAGPFDPRRFEEGFRIAMRAIAASGRALELNTRRLWPWIPQWWAEEGGRAVTFGSDAHQHWGLAANFPEATAMAEFFGFAPQRNPEEFWIR
jgi:histidinol-phosphatase (PHP family)